MSNTTYIPLNTVISYALDELDKSFGDADKFWLLGVRADALLRREFAGMPVTVRIPILPNKTAPFPANCKSWNKIGLLNENGEINTLRINNALTTFRDNNPNRLQNLTADVNDGLDYINSPFFNNYYYEGGFYQLFGYQNGIITYGDCKVDEENRVVVLNPNFQYDSIMFEYVPAPEMSGEYMVLEILQEAIIAFIKWKVKAGTQQDYTAASISARRSMPKKKVILQSVAQVVRESNGMKLRS